MGTEMSEEDKLNAELKKELLANADAENADDPVIEEIVTDIKVVEEAAEPEPEPEPEISERQAVLNEIAAGRKAEVMGEQAAAADDAGDTEDPVEEPETIAEEDQHLAYTRDGVEYVVLKINGEEIETPLNTLLASAQKYTAADVRLQKASTAIAEVGKWNADLQNKEQNLAEREKALNAQLAEVSLKVSESRGDLSKEDDAALKENLGSFVKSVFEEDAETAVENLTAALSGRDQHDTTPTMTKEEIQAIVADAVGEQTSIQDRRDMQADVQTEANQSHAEARSTFIAEFPDIVPGTKLWERTSEMAKAYSSRPENQDKTFLEIFQAAGNEARELVRELVPADTRKERKLTSASHVSSRSQQLTKSGVDQAPARTPTLDIIAGMHKRRRPTQHEN